MAYQGYVRFPTIHGEQIVFTAEDDLWLVTTAGGRAERLTAGVAEITNALFAPDGQSLAFTGKDEGPAEVYVMPVDGGPARRLTYEGAEAIIVGWRPDGSGIIYDSNAYQPMRRWHALHEVAPTGGPARVLPYGVAHSIAFGPRDSLIVGRNTEEPATWKRYRGGTAGYLWIDANGSGDFTRLLPDLAGNVSYPCWVGERVYFISDHEGVGNVYSCLPDGADLIRHTQHTDYYARGLSSDGRTLVYHAGGDLYTLRPDGTAGRKVEVTLTGARAHRARRFVSTAQYLDSWAIHPQGHQVALTARGKAFSMGAFEGAVIQHGDPDQTRYRAAAWLADGERMVAIADPVAEARLVVFAADGATAERTLESFDVGNVMEMRAAPVGEQVALLNHRGDFVLVNLADGSSTVFDHTDFGRDEMARHMRGIAWSPDAQWVAYAFGLSAQQVAIKLYHVPTGATHQITDPVLYDNQPAFDPNGKYLYFLGARDLDPVQDNLQFEWSFPKGIRPYLITLRNDQRSPFTPLPTPADAEGDDAKDADKADKAAQDGKTDGAKATKPTPEPVVIDLDGIQRRVVAFPVDEGRYSRIAGTHEGVVFSHFPVEGTLKKGWLPGVPEANGALEGYNFEKRKHETLVEGISDFTVTPNGKTLLYRAGERLRILKAGEKPPEGDDMPAEARQKPGRVSGWLDLDRVKVSIQPAAEWRQMYREAWRLQREQYWTPDMRGINWQVVYDRYAPLVDRIGSRAELSDLLWEMQGELGSSHAYEIGGEYRPHPEYHQGSLGVDWRFDDTTGRYHIARLLQGDVWDPEFTSPLLAPGVNAQVGDAVVAINGQAVTRDRSPQQLLVNQVGVEVAATLAPADGGATRVVTVRAIGDDHGARYRDWVAANRRAVHEATNGQVGYIHIPDMGEYGFALFHRGFLVEYDRPGLIVDVRWNGGGMVSNLVLEKLMRPRLGYSYQRWGNAAPYYIESPRASAGAIVALTDENAGSDGDIFSHAFKMLKLGPLVGKRTWGGVVGIDPYVPLADNSVTTQPEFAFWFNDVGWDVENYGTDPTIEVDYPPQAFMRGEDPQLARSIQEAQRLIAEHPSATPAPAMPPARSMQATFAAEGVAQPTRSGEAVKRGVAQTE
ncbi:MAG TPA: PDZ domain-containing protein [Ktedonobacterales bacterium]|nr:PDZ domain-containing protein [Ktedonobacterales bacterium]